MMLGFFMASYVHKEYSQQGCQTAIVYAFTSSMN